VPGSDPYSQREDERAREDDDYARALSRGRAERAREKAPEIPRVRQYQCREHPEQVANVAPRAMSGNGRDAAEPGVPFYYPIADGPFCGVCGRHMTRVYAPGELMHKVIT
jgi:hypothetical protein